MSIRIFTIVASIIISTCLSGCIISQIPPVNKFAASMMGKPINDVVEMNNALESYASRIGWVEKKYSKGPGGWVYVTPIRRDCLIHWEVNTVGIIIDYETEGVRCY